MLDAPSGGRGFQRLLVREDRRSAAAAAAWARVARVTAGRVKLKTVFASEVAVGLATGAVHRRVDGGTGRARLSALGRACLFRAEVCAGSGRGLGDEQEHEAPE